MALNFCTRSIKCLARSQRTLNVSAISSRRVPQILSTAITSKTPRRNFSSTSILKAAAVSQSQSTPSSSDSFHPLSSAKSGSSVLVSAPPKEKLLEDEVDIEALGSNPSIQITDRAAEQLRSISVRENDPNVALRLIVESGGCHGYQYKLELTSVNTDGSTPEDFLFVHPTKQPSHVLVDPISMTLLKGSTVDFTTELIGSSFNIIDNPQAKGGCGCGVSWEATV